MPQSDLTIPDTGCRYKESSRRCAQSSSYPLLRLYSSCHHFRSPSSDRPVSYSTSLVFIQDVCALTIAQMCNNRYNNIVYMCIVSYSPSQAGAAPYKNTIWPSKAGLWAKPGRNSRVFVSDPFCDLFLRMSAFPSFLPFGSCMFPSVYSYARRSVARPGCSHVTHAATPWDEVRANIQYLQNLAVLQRRLCFSNVTPENERDALLVVLPLRLYHSTRQRYILKTSQELVYVHVQRFLLELHTRRLNGAISSTLSVSFSVKCVVYQNMWFTPPSFLHSYGKVWAPGD